MQFSRSRIRRVLQTLTVEDWRSLLTLAGWKLSRPLFNVYYVFEADLVQTRELLPPLPAGFSVRLLRGEEISGFAAPLVDSGMSAADVRVRIRRDDLVALALTDGRELAGYAWTTFADAWIPEVRATLPLRSDEAVRFDTLVIPLWRGKGLHYPLTIRVSHYLYEQGYRRTLGWINALNTRSLRNQRRKGKRKVATIVSSPLLGLVHLHNLYSEAGITLEKRKPRFAAVKAVAELDGSSDGQTGKRVQGSGSYGAQRR